MVLVQFLFSTVNGKLLRNIIPENSVIVDQGALPNVFQNCFYIHSTEFGLSKSRNLAINNCSGAYCLISDDDVVFKDNVGHIIQSWFEKTNADILTFQIETPDGGQFKPYPQQAFKHTLRSLFRVSSIEIAFRRQSVQAAGLSFDERFGLGATFPTGEEVIFLTDAYRAGLNIHYVPVPIVIHPVESSGSALFHNDALLMAKGAMFVRALGLKGLLACVMFARAKYKYTGYSFSKVVTRMFKGVWQYYRVPA